MHEATKKELQSAAFERLIHHLRERKDVQNIDLMNTADFCRNCLSKWYMTSAKKKGIKLNYEIPQPAQKNSKKNLYYRHLDNVPENE